MDYNYVEIDKYAIQIQIKSAEKKFEETKLAYALALNNEYTCLHKEAIKKHPSLLGGVYELPLSNSEIRKYADDDCEDASYYSEVDEKRTIV